LTLQVIKSDESASRSAATRASVAVATLGAQQNGRILFRLLRAWITGLRVRRPFQPAPLCVYALRPPGYPHRLRNRLLVINAPIDLSHTTCLPTLTPAINRKGLLPGSTPVDY